MKHRALLVFEEGGVPHETDIEFHERTGRVLRIYLTECFVCGCIYHAVVYLGPRKGEAWCLRCGTDAE